MWKRKNKNKHLNEKTKKQVEEEKGKRSERLIGILKSQIDDFEIKLKTLQNQNPDLEKSVISKKIEEAEERIVPHEEETKLLMEKISKITRKVQKEEIQKQIHQNKKKELLQKKQNQVRKLERKVKNFKTSQEVKSVILLLERKSQKFKDRLLENKQYNQRKKRLKTELQQLKMEEETGSWKTRLTKKEILKRSRQELEIQQLTKLLDQQEKKLKRIEFQNTFRSNNTTDFFRFRQMLIKYQEKIEIALKENEKLQREVLETKELLGNETSSNTTTNTSELHTEDSQDQQKERKKKKKKKKKNSNSGFRKAMDKSKTTSTILVSNTRTLSDSNQTDSTTQKEIISKTILVTKIVSDPISEELKNSFPKLPTVSKGNRKLSWSLSKSVPSLHPLPRITLKKELTINSLQTLLSIPIGVEYFKEYLDSCMCQENIMFWMEVKSMKQNAESQKPKNKLEKVLPDKQLGH
ncbi:double hit isoform b [Anaeramoeba flamelloides]|uniref:Double hit isoform b n=1 Tax=Anaeramoeba flamelloides TaxID=1746091 RepID=A0AAV7Y0L9_9EUKA|nr:double hit isoform b [Anaeramoeba flamelloides]